MLGWRHVRAGAVKFPKSWLETLPLRQKIHRFFFSHTWGSRFKYLPEGCPYMLMYSALHIMQWFSQLLDACVHPENQMKNFSILTFLWIKTNVAYTSLEVIATQHSVLQVEFITGVQLICYFILYYYFLHWSHLPNMAVGDLAFYYTLYLWIKHFGTNFVILNIFSLLICHVTQYEAGLLLELLWNHWFPSRKWYFLSNKKLRRYR